MAVGYLAMLENQAALFGASDPASWPDPEQHPVVIHRTAGQGPHRPRRCPLILGAKASVADDGRRDYALTDQYRSQHRLRRDRPRIEPRA